jgi:hypothetical protein
MDKEAYTWAVHYTDGSSIREYDHPDGHGFAVVDSARVTFLTIESDLHSHAVGIPDGASPIFFRRRKILLQDGQRTTIHCIGWKRGDEAIYLFISDSGDTLLTDNLQAV